MKTQSKTYPKILRSKKENMIFFPDNIQKIQKENMEGIKEDFYEYDLIKIDNIGQQINNYDLFKIENYAELRKIAYGSWHDQLETIQEQGFTEWQNYCNQIKTKYPKAIVEYPKI